MLFFTFLNCSHIIIQLWLLSIGTCRHRQLSPQNGQQRVISRVVDPWNFGTDPDPAILVLDLQDANKKLFFSKFFCLLLFLKVNLHHFSKIKTIKESQNSGYQGFSYYFCLMIKGSGSGPLTNGVGFRRPKNIRWSTTLVIRSPDDEVHKWAGRVVEVSDEDSLLQGPDIEVQDVHPLLIKACAHTILNSPFVHQSFLQSGRTNPNRRWECGSESLGANVELKFEKKDV